MVFPNTIPINFLKKEDEKMKVNSFKILALCLILVLLCISLMMNLNVNQNEYSGAIMVMSTEYRG